MMYTTFQTVGRNSAHPIRVSPKLVKYATPMWFDAGKRIIPRATVYESDSLKKWMTLYAATNEISVVII